MKSKVVLIILAVLITQLGITQSVEELYIREDFKNLIKYVDKAEELTSEELYFVGYALFQLEDDLNAIKMYDKAIEKGLDEDYIYLYKGLALRYNRQYEDAIKNFKLAVDRNPSRQINHTELANVYYFMEDYDTALVHFYRARELPYEHGDPYYKIPNIFHVKQDFEKALEEYYISAELINKKDPVHGELFLAIGLLEYTVFKNFEKSIYAYKKVIELKPDDYDIYPKLIKAYYSNDEYDKGDSLITILKREFENGNLSENFTKFGNVSIAEFEWNNQKILVSKYFKEPTEILDIIFKVYLLSKDGKSVERTFMTEKSIQIGEGGVKHLLCEREKNGIHHTYQIGWATDDIKFNSLRDAIISVLNEDLVPKASSNFNVQKSEKKVKNKKKKKKEN